MAKRKVTGEDGKTYVMKEKKPFYKKIWFWVLIVIVVIGIGGGALGGDDKDTSANGGEQVKATDKSSSKDESSHKEKNTFYKVGDSVKVDDVTYTLNSVELTDQRNQFEDNQPAQVVKITYTVKNNGKEDIPVGADVEVYGSDDKKAETYANENTMGSVASGKQMDVTAHFALNQTGEIEIHFAPLISFEKAAKFKATV
ncbi:MULTISPECIES: DUF5067 domain-containing protein [Enterococcus]|uniref:DUF5067 domain-containing protein n=1 Tax=Enterococcus TaxID=1350 RepID=UPI00189DA416|nr:DUF5067 domain-containing protein [Enterococcus dispar]